MKVIKISDTSIEFVLTSKDLIDKNINIDKLSTEDIYIQYVVTDLIEEAELKHNITIVNNGKFKIYISNDKNSDMIIIISSFDPYENKYKLYEQIVQQLANKENMDSLQNYSAKSVEEKLQSKMQSNLPMIKTPQKVVKSTIYCFDNISDIKLIFDNLDIKLRDEILYKYKNKYYLILCFLKNNIGKKQIEIIFNEYATLVNQNNFDLILQEYGEGIIKQNARKIINLYY